MQGAGESSKYVNTEIEKEIRQLVIERIRTMPDNINISIGGDSDYTKEQIMKSVEIGDDAGQQFIRMQMDFLRAVTEGKVYQENE